MMTRKEVVFSILVVLLGAVAHPLRADLQLARNGTSAYCNVLPDRSTAVDDYAVSALTNFLFQKTGAVFPVISPGAVTPTTIKPAV